MLGPLSFGDILLIVLGLISGMLALYRGLTREVLSLVAWAVAAGAAFYFFSNQKEFAAGLSETIGAPPIVALIGVAALIFIVVLIVVHLITARISDAILDRQLGMVDRILGFFFGLARAFILVVIPYMFYESFVPKQQDQFEWVARSRSLDYVKATSDALKIVLLRAVETYYPDAIPDPAAPSRQGAENPAMKRQSAVLHRNQTAQGTHQLWRHRKSDGRVHEFVVRAPGSSGTS